MGLQIEVLTKEDLNQVMELLNSKIARLEELMSSENQHKKEWLTEKEARDFLGIGRTTLQNYRKDGVLSFSQVGAKIYYRRDDLEKHIQDHYVNKIQSYG